MNPQFIFSCKEENLSKIEDGIKSVGLKIIKIASAVCDDGTVAYMNYLCDESDDFDWLSASEKRDYTEFRLNFAAHPYIEFPYVYNKSECEYSGRIYLDESLIEDKNLKSKYSAYYKSLKKWFKQNSTSTTRETATLNFYAF